MNVSDILDQEALGLAADIKAGNLSAEELMRATLDRIEQVNPQVNAIVSLRDPDELIAEARQADQSERKGWMHGFPLAVKDLANAKGLRTTMGSPVFADQVAPKDDIVVARMRAAGAIIIGKTNTPEFGLGSNTFNPVFGATCNPFDLTRSAGGSSGGAAAALACRMLPVADGSDMMGSLRNPAAWNNVFGFRPSWGRVPSEPIGDSFLHQLATNGPMARSPKDIAALLDVQSGPDARQPHGCPDEPALPGIEADVKGRRIGWLRDWGGAYAFEPGILESSVDALGSFNDIGCILEEVSPPFEAEAIWESWTTLRSWSVAAATAALLENEETRHRLKPEAIWEIERGLRFSAMDVHRASLIRTNWFKAAAALFDRYDALILPSTQAWPFPIEWRYPESIGESEMDTYHRWMEVVVPVSLIGLPCLNMPAGFNAQGLPLGLQMFGRRGADAALLQLGQAWHAATNNVRRKPPILASA